VLGSRSWKSALPSLLWPGPWALVRGKIRLRTPLVLGLCGTQAMGSSIWACRGLLPTKTSQLLILLCGNGPSFISNGSHVFLTRFVHLFSRWSSLILRTPPGMEATQVTGSSEGAYRDLYYPLRTHLVNLSSIGVYLVMCGSIWYYVHQVVGCGT